MVLPLSWATELMPDFTPVATLVQDEFMLWVKQDSPVQTVGDFVKAVSTFADPLHYCEGIPFVAVNGQLVVDGGRITSARPGRIVSGPGTRRVD